MKKQKSCPCGSNKNYNVCCLPFHNKETFPQTAEQLMRSRYAAFAKKLLDYLIETHHPAHFDSSSIKSIQNTFKTCQWTGLTILDKNEGSKNDDTGTVRFKADFYEDNKIQSMEENSVFVKMDGRWFYQSGK